MMTSCFNSIIVNNGDGKWDKEVVVAKYAPTTQHNAIEGKQQMYFYISEDVGKKGQSQFEK